MYLDTTDELTSVQQKIRDIQARLGQPHDAALSGASTRARPADADAESCASASDATSSCSLASYSSKSGLLKRINRRLRQKSGLLNDIVHRQTFYAYCLKLLTLFVIALVHFSYIRPFLDTLALLEDYSAKVETKFAATAAGGKPLTPPPPPATPMAGAANNAGAVVVLHEHGLQDARIILRREVDVLNDYKKNVWMTVAAMCVALSTSCFFLFILPITRSVRRFQLIVIGVVDLISFAALPLLLLARAELVTHITAGLPESLRVAHRLVSAERLMNALQCTIHPREKLAFCSDVLVDSVFPVALLKYLVILCVLTLAYIVLAYVIDYCLKHWFPPHHRRPVADSSAPLAAGSAAAARFAGGQCFPAECDCGAAAWAADCGCYADGGGKQLATRALNNKTYLPALLVPMKGAKDNVGDEFLFGIRPPMPTLLPNPLVGQLSPMTESSPQKETAVSSADTVALPKEDAESSSVPGANANEPTDPK